MPCRASAVPAGYRERNQMQRDHRQRRRQWVRFEFRRGAIILAMAVASWGVVTGLGWGLWVVVGAVLGFV
jgi:fatty acid desaturase